MIKLSTNTKLFVARWPRRAVYLFRRFLGLSVTKVLAERGGIKWVLDLFNLELEKNVSFFYPLDCRESQ